MKVTLGMEPRTKNGGTEKEKEPKPLIPWNCYARPEPRSLRFTLWEEINFHFVEVTVFWVLCYLQGKVLIHDKDSSRHFQICPSLWLLFCLLRLSWTKISAMTVSPAAPDSPNHPLSLMVFHLTFWYLVFPMDREQEHMSENNNAKYMTRFPLKYQHTAMYSVGSQ